MSKKTLADQMAAATKTKPKPVKKQAAPERVKRPVDSERGRGGHLVTSRRSFPKRITLDLSEAQNDYLREQGIDLGGSKAEVLRALIGELGTDQKLRDRVTGRIRQDRRDQILV